MATDSSSSDPITEPAQFDSHHVLTTPTESTEVVDHSLTPRTAHCGPSEHKGTQCVLCVVIVQLLIIWCVHSIHMQGLSGGNQGASDRTMFIVWLSYDEGGAPRLWNTVLKALKNVGYTSLVGDVERTLFEHQ